MKVTHQWSFPVILRMNRDYTKLDDHVQVIYPTFRESNVVVDYLTSIPRYDEEGTEYSLPELVKAAKAHMIHQLNLYLGHDPRELALLDPLDHDSYKKAQPLAYKESTQLILHKAYVDVSLTELDYTNYCAVDLDGDKQTLVDMLVSEILDDEQVEAHWTVKRTPNVGIEMRRDHLTLSLLPHEVYVSVDLPDTETCDVVFDLWSTIRLYSAMQRRRFRYDRQQKQHAVYNERRSALYALRSLSPHRGK